MNGCVVFDALPAELETKFVGYTQLQAEGKVVALASEALVDTLENGMQGTILTDVTPFYGTMGGQVGDTGVILMRKGIKEGKALDK